MYLCVHKTCMCVCKRWKQHLNRLRCVNVFGCIQTMHGRLQTLKATTQPSEGGKCFRVCRRYAWTFVNVEGNGKSRLHSFVCMQIADKFCKKMKLCYLYVLIQI